MRERGRVRGAVASWLVLMVNVAGEMVSTCLM